jgi:hypothetical protein
MANAGFHGFSQPRPLPAVEASFTADGSVYLTAPRPMVLTNPTATPGTATMTYAWSAAASPTSFTTFTTWPRGLNTGDTLRVTATGVSTFETVRLTRIA